MFKSIPYLLILLQCKPTATNGFTYLLQEIVCLWEKPEVKGLGILASLAGSAIAILKFLFPTFYKKVLTALGLKSRSAEAQPIDSIIQNLTLLTNPSELQEFHDAGNPPYIAGLQKIIKKERTTNLIVVTGASGMGKSFLAKKVAYDYAVQQVNKRKFDVVWWIDAENISLKSASPESNLNRDLYDLAQTALFQIDMANPNWLFQLRHALQNYNYLLIFDNACDLGSKDELPIDDFKLRYLPTPNPNKTQKIIITSKNGAFKSNLEVKVWSFAAYESYLEKNLEKKDLQDSAAIKKLYDQLGGLPLAISFAVAYMIEQGSTPTMYNILLHSTKIHRGNNIFKTFKISYEALNERSQALLNLTAFLAADEIPLMQLFDAAQKPSKGSKDFHKTLAPLKKYYFLKSEHGDTLQSIHRFWREALLMVIEEEKKTNEVYAHTFGQLELAIANFKGEQYDFYRNILTHIEVFAAHYSNDLAPGAMIHQKLEGLVRKAATHAFNIGSVSQAIRLNEKALAISPNNLKLAHEIGLDNAHNLILRDHCQEALALASSAYSYFSEVYKGADQIELMEKARQRIAKVQQRRGNFQIAKQYLEICKERLNDERLEPQQGRIAAQQELYSGVLHDLGSVFWEEGLDYQQSLTYLNEAINYKKELNGGNENDQYIHLSRMIRGVVNALQGNYTEQAKEHKEVFKFFSSIKEYRRQIYTAYYLLHFGWDKAGWQERYTNEFDEYEIYFTEWNEFNDILEGDVKYAIIKAVFALRKAVRLQFNKANDQDARKKYEDLVAILKNKNGESPNQYLDDGTVAVSAVLDYALYLDDTIAHKKNKEKTTLLKEVISFASDLLTIKNTSNWEHMKVIYHRANELEHLAEKHNVDPQTKPSNL